MTTEQLQEKLAAAEQKVEKCRKTIERHKAQMEKKGKQLREMGIDPEAADKYSFVRNGSDMNREAYWLLSDYDSKKSDIKGATEKLRNAERVCENWKHKLAMEKEKDAIIQKEVPQIIKDFLDNWKANAFHWYCCRYVEFLAFRKQLKIEERDARMEAIRTLPEFERERERWQQLFGDGEPDDSFLLNAFPRRVMDAFLKERDLDYWSIKKRLNNFADQFILKMCEFRDKGEREEWLKSALEQEKRQKMLELVGRIHDITGTITDAKGLSLSAGDLNGVLIGEKGAASVNTIGAGGYNIQCFHYRTLIRDVTEKVMGKPGLDAVIGACAEQARDPQSGPAARDELER